MLECFLLLLLHELFPFEKREKQQMQKTWHDVPPRFALMIIALVAILLVAREIVSGQRHRKPPAASNDDTKGTVAGRSSRRDWLGIAKFVVSVGDVVAEILTTILPHFWR